MYIYIYIIFYIYTVTVCHLSPIHFATEAAPRLERHPAGRLRRS